MRLAASPLKGQTNKFTIVRISIPTAKMEIKGIILCIVFLNKYDNPAAININPADIPNANAMIGTFVSPAVS